MSIFNRFTSIFTFSNLHILLLTLRSMLRFYLLLSLLLPFLLIYSSLMILYDAVPARRSDWGTILFPENLVPDGFSIILWLMLCDHNVAVYAMCMHHNVICGLVPAKLFFHIISQTARFGGELLNIKCVLISSTIFV